MSKLWTIRTAWRAVAPVAIAWTMAATAAHAQPIYSTGVDAAGAALGSAVPDPHWTFVKDAPTSSSGAAVTVGSGFFPGCCGAPPYTANRATARWISTVEGAFTGLGDVTYTQTFDLSGYDRSTVALSAEFGIADGFLGVFLNGTRLGVDGIGLADLNSTVSPWADTFLHTFAVAAGDPLFLAGVNVLEFRASVENSTHNGLFVDIASSGQLLSAVPEPASVALVGSGLLLVGAAIRRRRHA